MCHLPGPPVLLGYWMLQSCAGTFSVLLMVDLPSLRSCAWWPTSCQHKPLCFCHMQFLECRFLFIQHIHLVNKNMQKYNMKTAVNWKIWLPNLLFKYLFSNLHSYLNESIHNCNIDEPWSDNRRNDVNFRGMTLNSS